MAKMPDPSWLDGIRSLRPDEFPQLDTLLSTVFRPGMPQQYPHIYTPEDTANLRVVVENGEVVSHIGTIRRHASIMGCTIKVASLGGVATHPDHRGKGHATALFEDTMCDCREDGVDFIVVSGYRKIYHRYGCRYVGHDWDFVVEREQAENFADAGLEVRPLGDEDVPALAALYRREPVRWLRPPSDFHHALKGYVMNAPADVLGIYEGKALRAYVILQGQRRSDPLKRNHVVEYAGDRRCVAGVLGALLQGRGVDSIGVHVAEYDSLLYDLLAERGLEGRSAPTSGTVTLVNFVQLMERLRPHFVEKLGPAAEDLTFRRRGDQLIFGFGSDRVVAPDQGAAAELIFSTPDRREQALLGDGPASTALRQIFPVPGLWYGPNYV